jgi:cysteine desulfurase
MDHLATTPVDPRVVEEMVPCFTETFGNAASRTHAYGWDAQEVVDGARERVARLIGAQPKEIIFTSGATEANNLAIKGVAQLHPDGHIVTQATEHHAVIDPCRALERLGHRVTVLPVDSHGRVSPEAVEAAISEETFLVSIMAANNEVGTLQPLARIGRICQTRSVLFHTDATQAVGKVPIDVEAWGIGLLSISAHKIYGPKGVGALFVRHRPRVRLVAQIDGGGHERGMRSGTLNVPGIVGLGYACEIARESMAEEAQRLSALRDRLLSGIQAELEGVHLNGHADETLPGCLNLSFVGIDGESLLMGLSGIALSSGSACTSAALEPSYVLKALGVPDNLARSSLRFGLGRFNTEEEVDHVVTRVIAEVDRLRQIAPGPARIRQGREPRQATRQGGI